MDGELLFRFQLAWIETGPAMRKVASRSTSRLDVPLKNSCAVEASCRASLSPAARRESSASVCFSPKGALEEGSSSSEIIAKIGAQARYYRTDPARQWVPDLDHLASVVTPKARTIVVIDPNNPTGAVYSTETRRAILNLADTHGLTIIADEVYGDLGYEGTVPLLGSLDPDAPIITFSSLSKAYLAPGWRAGWMGVGRSPRLDDVVNAIGKLADARLCSTVPMQYAVVAALQGDRSHQVAFRAALAERGAITASSLNAIPGITCVPPKAAFYVMPKVSLPKGKTDEDLRGAPYVLNMAEVSRRTEEAWRRGATEVCLQGGIHPAFTGQTYLDVLRAVKDAAPDMHVHAFSPLEVTQGAKTLGLTLEAFLKQLKAAGLGTLPGTAAEILDDEVRQQICPDKVNTAEWLGVMRTAHKLGLRTTSTIMFGHLETPRHWARHLLAIRNLQTETGGFTEFVPLPFVHMEAPMYRRGLARPGPTWREVVLMHSIARLVLGPVLRNIQVSWVKLGEEGAARILNAGANDLGGTLMNESISRAAGASFGQELPPDRMDALIERIGRRAVHRTTLYGTPTEERVAAGYAAAPLQVLRFQSAREYRAGG